MSAFVSWATKIVKKTAVPKARQQELESERERQSESESERRAKGNKKQFEKQKLFELRARKFFQQLL